MVSHSGVYTIKAKNKSNEITLSCKVTVKENPQKLRRPVIEGLYAYGSRQDTYRPPQFVIKPTNQNVHEGKNLVIYAKFTGMSLNFVIGLSSFITLITIKKVFLSPKYPGLETGSR